ncbi:hypothetical protein ACHAWC_000573 [Mediolabrus comicus]
MTIKSSFPSAAISLVVAAVYLSSPSSYATAFIINPSAASASSVGSASSLFMSETATAVEVNEIKDKNDDNERLIAAAKDFVNTASGFYSDLRPDLYSEQFVMRGPAVGPLNKSDYCFTMSELKIWEAFPDIQANAFGFSIDPENSDKVWFFVRNTGTNTGPISFGSKVPLIPATNKKVRGPTEAFSIEFDSDLKVRGLTIGYPCNRFEGNTGGLGAFIGLLTGCGLDFLPSIKSPLFKFIQKTGQKIEGYPKTFSNPEDLPSWWESSDVLGADGL